MKKIIIIIIVIALIITACSGKKENDAHYGIITPSPTPIECEYIPATDSSVSDVSVPTLAPTSAEVQPDTRYEGYNDFCRHLWRL